MSLFKELRPGSFRGVPFGVKGSGMAAGRRTQVHEYPQRDKPFAQDLGRATRDINVEAFVVGLDYIAQANRLLEALEKPGPGALVHPWFGTLTVAIKTDGARVEFDGGLGEAKFTLNFVESGELAFPAASNSTAGQSRLAAANIENVAVEDFSKLFKVAGMQDFVAQDATASLTSVFGLVAGGGVPGASAFGYAATAPNMLKAALGLLGNPLALGQTIAGFIGVSGLATSAQRWSSLAQSLLRMVMQPGLSAPAPPVVYTPSRQQSYTNTVAINALTRQLLLAQAVGASSLVTTDVYDDAVELRTGIATALDAESLTANDATYTTLQAARSNVWSDMTARSRDGARLTTNTPAETMPALVLAYDLYEDAARDSEICTRNAVRHPGFVPPRTLKVLTR